MYIKFTQTPDIGTEHRYNLIDTAGWQIRLEGSGIYMFPPGGINGGNPLPILFRDRHTARKIFVAICDAAERGDTIYKIPSETILGHANTTENR